MIYGIGHDIVENIRMSRLLAQYGNKFVEKILTPTEIIIYDKSRTKIQYLAKRFAAKESFAKACGTGIRYPITFLNVAILNDELGKPIFKFATKLHDWLRDNNITNTHLSISDEHHYTSAFVILEIIENKEEYPPRTN